MTEIYMASLQEACIIVDARPPTRDIKKLQWASGIIFIEMKRLHDLVCEYEDGVAVSKPVGRDDQEAAVAPI